MPVANANIARHLGAMAAARPQAPALKVPHGRTRSGDIDYLTLTFAELDQEVAAWCIRLAARGVGRGDRTLVMVRPGLPLIASVFALFRLGAVPVVIDPGMKLKNFLPCVARTRPRALIGIPLAQWISRLFRRSFQSLAVRVPASASTTARLFRGPAASALPNPAPAFSSAKDLAAILFTSGSTGTPKGVCYEHGMFEAQVRLIGETFAIAPGEIDLPLLPIFALFNPALGMTTIVPEMNPRRPAAADPAKIVQAIRQEQVTNSFGSPTLWGRIADYCRGRDLTLPSLRRVLCAGAPVPRALWSLSLPLLPNGRLHSPYGATEALPVSSIASDEAEPLASAPPGRLEGAGACVGRPLPGIEARIVSLIAGPIATLAEARELPQGEIGEIIVQGAHVTREYDRLPEATRRAKIAGGESGPEGSRAAVWHRMGDCGHFDSAGRLWYCGRQAEIVATPEGPMFTEPCEQVFRRHPEVVRCALIGLGQPGRQTPALVVEARIRRGRRPAFARELRTLARADPATAAISRFFFRARFPVDVRHNAKIHRLALAKWAAPRRPLICPA